MNSISVEWLQITILMVRLHRDIVLLLACFYTIVLDNNEGLKLNLSMLATQLRFFLLFLSSAKFSLSLRHTFRDRLRAAEVPLEAIDQFGGWSSVSSIGSKYGRGYSVEHLREFMGRLKMV